MDIASYEVTGWKPKFNKIRFVKSLMQNGDYSLGISKSIVDDILEGKVVFVKIQENKKDLFLKEAKGNFLEIKEL